MSWIDIGIIALMVLLGLFGVLKGFKKSLLSLGAFLVSFVLAFFLANVIAEALLGIEGVKNFVLGDGFGENSSFSLANMIYNMGSGEGATIPSTFLLEHYTMPILEIIAKANVTVVDPSQGYAMYLAFIMFSAICGVGIFIVVRFLLVIVTVIIKSFIGKKKSPVSRLVGFFIGAIRGALWAFAITLVFSCFGGMTFMPGVNYIEDEYEHKNAVFCQYFNEGAYYIRNKLFLPNADAYGRLVEMVFKKPQGDGNEGEHENLTGDVLNLYIGLSNLNYANNPWSKDENNKRVFDENNAIAYNADEFEGVGFDRVMKAIFDYNSQAAAIVDSGELTEETCFKYKEFVYVNTNSVAVKLTSLVDALHVYMQDYEHGKRLTDKTDIAAWNVQLSDDYNTITGYIDNITEQYSHTELLGVFPDLSELIPERVNAGPQTSVPSEEENGNEEGEQEQNTLEAMLRKRAVVIV